MDEIIDSIFFGMGISYWTHGRVAQQPEEDLIEHSDDDIISSPERMYDLSLKTRSRLPNRLHESMLMWSFDPRFTDHVRMYLDWVDHCEQRERSRIEFEKRMRFCDRCLAFSMVCCGILLGLVLLMGAMK